MHSWSVLEDLEYLLMSAPAHAPRTGLERARGPRMCQAEAMRTARAPEHPLYCRHRGRDFLTWQTLPREATFGCMRRALSKWFVSRIAVAGMFLLLTTVGGAMGAVPAPTTDYNITLVTDSTPDLTDIKDYLRSI